MLSASELNAIVEGLGQIAEKAAASRDFLDDETAEDVHHFVEKRLVELVGESGYKLHSGRSRNEQIATDLRLYVRHSIDQAREQIADLIAVLLARAEQAGGAAMPSYTHLQRAEPVLLAHWLLAYVEMLLRDMERLAYLARYRRILSEDNPTLPNVDQDRIAAETDYINQDARAALEEFKRLRWETIQTLARAPVEVWSRAGTHETDGPMTVEQLLIRQIKGNDLNHLVQMKDIVRLKMPW